MGIVRIAVLSSLSCLAVVALPRTRFFWGLLWAAILFAGGRTLKRSQLAGLLVFNIALLYLLYPGHGQLYYILVAGLSGLVMGMLHGDGAGYVNIRRGGIAAGLLGATIFLGVIFSVVSPLSLAGLQGEAQAFAASMAQQAREAGILDVYAQSGLAMTELEALLNVVAEWIAFHMPGFLYLEALAMVFLSLTLGTFIVRRESEVRRKPFVQEQMPWPLIWLVILGLGLVIWGYDARNLLYYLGSNILLVLTPLAVYFGLAVAFYRFRLSAGPWRTVGLGIFILMVLLFPNYIFILLAVVGLFDALIDYRHLRQTS